ncbi:hypothetical protein F4677DRAFT_409423 [Hypoxylon crocopeplum]|nr:hypothetical protein F4677DRAFT_409423 [Hypoxylon crocopeplum]
MLFRTFSRRNISFTVYSTLALKATHQMLCQLLLALAFSSWAVAADPNFRALFEPYVSPGVEMAISSDPEFADVVSSRWSTWQAPTYQAAVKPVNEADVQQIVRIAGRNNISFLATLNGHGTSFGYGNLQNALNINLANFNSVTVDAANNRMTVGGGVTFGDLAEPLAQAGKEIQTGNAVCVGMVGATIGGGIGTMQGLHGLVLDALESVRLVTATGDIVNASASENPDLFWGIRGAGANFGIITSATYVVYDEINNGRATLAHFDFPVSANRSIWELLRSYDDYIPAPLALIPSIQYNHTINETSIGFGLVYYGTQKEAQPYINQIAALNPTSSSIQNLTTGELHEVFSQGVCDKGSRHHVYTVGLRKTDTATLEETLDDMIDFYETHPDYRGSLAIQRYSNEAMLRVPQNDTAYPWRSINAYLLFDNTYTDPAIDADVYDISRTVRSRFEATSGFREPQVYLNYDHGDEPLTQVYGASKLPRLRALKARWDPKRLFGVGNPIH